MTLTQGLNRSMNRMLLVVLAGGGAMLILLIHFS